MVFFFLLKQKGGKRLRKVPPTFFLFSPKNFLNKTLKERMVLSTLIDILMAVLPPAAYIQQYLSIRKTRNASGFSTLVSFILIISGILRIFFWYC